MQVEPVFPQICYQAFLKDAGTAISEVVVEDALPVGNLDARRNHIFFRNTPTGILVRARKTNGKGQIFNLAPVVEISGSNLVEISNLIEGLKWDSYILKARNG